MVNMGITVNEYSPGVLSNSKHRRVNGAVCFPVFSFAIHLSFSFRLSFSHSITSLKPIILAFSSIQLNKLSCISRRALRLTRNLVTAGENITGVSNGTIPEPRRTYEAVVAATKTMGIGKDGKLPWRLPSDLKFFKNLTMTTSDPAKKNAVIMGRKTWESIPLQHRPLPGRLNVVLTRSGSFDLATTENVIKSGSVISALDMLSSSPYRLSIENVFVIGGGQIFRESLNARECDAIHITEIETDIDCDTFIPAIDVTQFQPWCSSLPMVENGIRYCFTTYVRIWDSAAKNIV